MQFIIQSNQPIAPSVYRMRLLGDTRGILRPGQFVQIALPGFYLRRPISVCDWIPAENGLLEIIYKTVGSGTAAMADLPVGASVDTLTGLGNGYQLSVPESQSPLLAGGGVGIPPLYGLCKALVANGQSPIVILGFNTANEAFLKEEFEALGVSCVLCTADGTAGVKGFVTDGMQDLSTSYDYVFTCGPEPMLKAVYALCDAKGIGGQFSFEERMACGFGVCMGCSCQTKYGSKRICKDGPVLCKEEILW